MIESYYNLPVFLRILLAVGVLVLIMIVEIILKKKDAFRWKGYSIWLLMAFAGMVFGFCLDLITIQISPEYYRLGKGVNVDNIWLACANVGGAAGFLAGTVFGGIILIRNRGMVIASKGVPWSLLKSIRYILLLGVIGAAMGYFCPLVFAPNPTLASMISPDEVADFF